MESLISRITTGIAVTFIGGILVLHIDKVFYSPGPPNDTFSAASTQDSATSDLNESRESTPSPIPAYSSPEITTTTLAPKNPEDSNGIDPSTLGKSELELGELYSAEEMQRPEENYEPLEFGATEEMTFEHPQDYGGTVWFQISPQQAHIGKTHFVSAVWGPWKFEGYFELDQLTTFNHTKEYGTSEPLTIHVYPAAHIDFGNGSASTYSVIDTNGLWTAR